MKIKVDMKWIYVLMLSLIGAYFLGGDLPYVILYALVGLVLYSSYYIYRMKKGLKVSMELRKDRVVTGEVVDLNQYVLNKTDVPIANLKVINSKPESIDGVKEEISSYITSKDNKEFAMKISARHRGVYNLGGIKLIIQDPFGVYTAYSNSKIEAVLHAYPKVFRLRNEIDIKSNYIDADRLWEKGKEERHLIKDIRKYSYGDDLKRIHWKITAKSDKLMVKNYEKVIGNQTYIFVDLNEENMNEIDNEEKMVEYTVSMLYQFIYRGIKGRVFINSFDEGEFDMQTHRDFYQVYEFFKNTKSDGKVEFHEYIKNNINKLTSGAWIGVVCMGVSLKLQNYLIYLNERGFNVALFYDECNEEKVTLLKKFGIDCNKVQVREDKVIKMTMNS